MAKKDNFEACIASLLSLFRLQNSKGISKGPFFLLLVYGNPIWCPKGLFWIPVVKSLHAMYFYPKLAKMTKMRIFSNTSIFKQSIEKL